MIWPTCEGISSIPVDSLSTTNLGLKHRLHMSVAPMALAFRGQFSFKIPATLPGLSLPKVNVLAKAPRYDETDSIAVSKTRRRIRLGQDSKGSGLGNGWTASSDIARPIIISYDIDSIRTLHNLPTSWTMIAIYGIWKGYMDSTEARMLYSIERNYCEILRHILGQCVLDHTFRRPKDGPMSSDHHLIEKPLDWEMVATDIAERLKNKPGFVMLGPRDLTPLLEVHLLSTSDIAWTHQDEAMRLLLKQSRDSYSIIKRLDWLDFPNNRTQWLTEGTWVTIKPVYHSQMEYLLQKRDYNISFQVCGPFVAWLSWDPSNEAFVGWVPHFSAQMSEEKCSQQSSSDEGCRHAPLNVHKKLIRIEVKAKLSVKVSGSLRYERTIRARLTYTVSPEPPPVPPKRRIPVWERAVEDSEQLVAL